jgi:putative peptidoglycan lipid II flippase
VLLAADHRIDWLALGEHPGLRVLVLTGVLAAAGLAYFSGLFLCGFRPADFTRRSR